MVRCIICRTTHHFCFERKQNTVNSKRFFFWIIIFTGSTQFSSGWCATVPATHVFCRSFFGTLICFWLRLWLSLYFWNWLSQITLKDRLWHCWPTQCNCWYTAEFRIVIDEVSTTPVTSSAVELSREPSVVLKWIKIFLVNNHWQLWEKGSKQQKWLWLWNQPPNDLYHLKI